MALMHIVPDMVMSIRRRSRQMDGRYIEGKCGDGANWRRYRHIGLGENDCIATLLCRINARGAAGSPRDGSGEQNRLRKQ